MIAVERGCLCDVCNRKATVYDPRKRRWLCAKRCIMEVVAVEDQLTVKLRKEAMKEAARRKRDAISNKKAREKREAAKANAEVWQQKKPTVPMYKTGHKDIRE